MAKKKVKNMKKKALPGKKSKSKLASKRRQKNVVVWFEIPVTVLDRAMKFYSTILGVKMESMDMGDSKGAMFPSSRGAASGALIQSKESIPSTSGTMIYLDGGKDLSVPLDRVQSAGGKVIQEKIEIGEYGFMAIFEDSEGNHVALHSMS